ncbi:MAG: hypothetical protein COT74_05925 [Bdellovibrionales bacterium CG10_big_fil_rev_8_21_14_0_10_45_34]|nr:MAG: hypothetical protein COT74_05925 [Bdellovibrionales bacterium CG10_big_fil_rev_8_21_14_0_10_45_34]
MAVLTFISIRQFEQSIKEEMHRRLDSNRRELSALLTEIENYLFDFGQVKSRDPNLAFGMSLNQKSALRSKLSDWIVDSKLSRLSAFDSTGRLLISYLREGNSVIKSQHSLENADVFIPEAVREELEYKEHVLYRDASRRFGLELITYNRVHNSSGKVVGFLEQSINLSGEYLKDLKERLLVDLVVTDSQLNPVVSTDDQFLQISPGMFTANQEPSAFKIRDLEYFIAPLQVDARAGQFALAAVSSLEGSKITVERLTRLLVSVSGVLIFILAVTLMALSRFVVKPLNELVVAAERVAGGDYAPLKLRRWAPSEIERLSVSFGQMVARINESRAQLQEKVQQLQVANENLKETQAQLVHSAKMVGLGQLVAGIAHELNNPISFVYANIRHLKEHTAKLFDTIKEFSAKAGVKEAQAILSKNEFEYIEADLPKLISSFEEGSQRVKEIVTGLRSFSRSEDQQAHGFDVNEGLKTTLSLISGELKTRINVKTSFGDLPEIQCVSGQINQVFMNILTNAAQAIPGEGEISVATKSKGDFVIVEIADNGEGMSAETQKRIFEPFYTTKPVGEGTGLGLSISYSLIQKHGGKIEVTSKPGKGTKFTISLPVSANV